MQENRMNKKKVSLKIKMMKKRKRCPAVRDTIKRGRLMPLIVKKVHNNNQISSEGELLTIPSHRKI
jgi:hypothetical protein